VAVGAVGNRRHIQLAQAGFPTIGANSFALVPSNDQINLHSYSAFNAGTASCDVGLGVAFANIPSAWNMYTYNGTAAVKVTATIQAASAINLFTTTTNSGFLLGCKAPFGYVMLTIAQAQSGSPVYSYQYWNGTAWTTLNMTATPAYTGTGVIYLVFNPPVDWAVGDGGLGDNDKYTIRVRSTTAGGQSVTANQERVSRWIAYNANTLGQSRFQATFENCPYLLEGGEQLSPYFATANNLNTFEASFQINP
jgi:hypothetical protein